MGCSVEMTPTGVELDVHKFDHRSNAVDYLTANGYQYDRHETWAFTTGITFYFGPNENQRASLRLHQGYWTIALWIREVN